MAVVTPSFLNFGLVTVVTRNLFARVFAPEPPRRAVVVAVQRFRTDGTQPMGVPAFGTVEAKPGGFKSSVSGRVGHEPSVVREVQFRAARYGDLGGPWRFRVVIGKWLFFG